MVKTLRLLLGDQLNQQHSWFKIRDENITYLLMELRQETDYVVHHVQKIVAFFAAMRRFAVWLEEHGHTVRYLRLDDPANTGDLSEAIAALVKNEGFSRFEYILPDEYRLELQLAELNNKIGITCSSCESEHFLSERAELGDFFGSRNYLMETFYREIRRRNDWLMHDGKPEGGRWNYDRENRKSLPAGQVVAPPKMFDHDLSPLTEMLASCQVASIGSIEAKHVIWPLDRSESLQLLDYFLENCLTDFGSYQDAMHSDHWSLFHSRLSFSLNTKMITPREVVERAISAFRQDQRISLPAIEGFIRQIIGWREFMRGVYWANMPAYAKLNELGHKRPLPGFYWTGETRMNCLHQAISQSLEHAYAHHIQRLMITGNFALLTGIDPDAVERWYLGIYIDAIQWVEMPNTRGMSQFADGGMVATKPYVSSANYINKMSNYCRSCRYNQKQRTGHDACPFNALYWNFLISHRERFNANHRMRMIYSQLDRLGDEEKKQTVEQAGACLDDLDAL